MKHSELGALNFWIAASLKQHHQNRLEAGHDNLPAVTVTPCWHTIECFPHLAMLTLSIRDSPFGHSVPISAAVDMS